MTYFTEVFIPKVWAEFLELLTAPAINPEVWWIITPLIITLVLMTFYFGRYAKEEFGYNTAVGNSVVLLFVGIDLLRYLYYSEFPPSLLAYQHRPIVTIICLLVMLEAITLLYSSFFHALPKKFTYWICSPLPVNLQAYVAIALVYSRITFDWYTLIASMVLFFLLFILLHVLQFFQKMLTEIIHKAKIEEAKEEKKQAEQMKREAKKKEKELRKKEKEKH